MYAGAIVVLFLFVIMLLGVDKAEDLHDRAVPDPAPVGGGRRARPGRAARSPPSSAARDTIAEGATARVGRRQQHPRSSPQQPVPGPRVRVRVHVGAADRRRRRHRAAHPQVEARRRRVTPVIAAAVPTTTYYLVLSARAVRARRGRCAGAPQPARDVHVHRADAQRRQPELRRASARFGNIDGQTAVFFVMVVAAAEVVVGLGIIISILKRRPGATADDLAELEGLDPCSTSSG